MQALPHMLHYDDTIIVVGDDQYPVRMRRVEVEVDPQWVELLTPLVDQLRRDCGLQTAILSKFEAGLLAEGAGAEELRKLLVQASADFRDKAPVSAAEAATIILDGVRSGHWRILIGEDARKLDAAVRAKPEAAYDYNQLFSELTAETPEQ